VATLSLEERLQAIEDRAALADLVHDYARLVDECEPEGVAALFTDDAKIDYGPALGGLQQGRDAVNRFFQGLHSKDGWRFAARKESQHGQEGFDVEWDWVPRKERPK
jgi:hypothetical protein